MALRVLLADESSTIKKVMQLALQDFGVEVKSVPIGLDVLQVARSFLPDIIFADVLLSKKNGYEVSAEIKGDSGLKKIPVVLMWSGFMELDEAKAKSCGAERRLEKPFDADHLRSLVKDLVPRLNENKISDFLSFPDLPDIVETPLEGLGPEASLPAAPKAPAPKSSPTPPDESVFELDSLSSIDIAGPGANAPDGIMDVPPPPPKKAPPPPPPKAPAAKPADAVDFGAIDRDLEDPDEFQQVPLPGSRSKNAFEQKETEDWRATSLEQFRVTPPEATGEPDPFENPDGMMEVSDASIAMTGGVEDISLEDLEELTASGTRKAPPPPAKKPAPAQAAPRAASTPVSAEALATLDPIRAEEVLREQVREVLESIAWKIIPDIAERVVREEVQRLLKEAERLS